MDGANMNALVGLARPGDIGSDVSPSQPAQDLLHPAWRRRSRHGPDRRQGAPRALPARPPVVRTGGDGAVVGGAVRLGLASCRSPGPTACMMGGDGLTQATEGRDPQRQLHRRAAARRTIPCSTRRRRPRRARMHPRHCAAQGTRRRHGRRRRQAADRLRLPCADHELAGGRHADDRADRDRAQGRARPLLRRDARASRRSRARSRQGRLDRRTTRCKHAPHTVEDLVGDWNRPYTPRGGLLPAAARSASTSTGRRSTASTTPMATGT